jgi:predicted nucleotidyltransferase
MPECLSISLFKSSGIDNVTIAILLPPVNYVDKRKYVYIYKYFYYLLRQPTNLELLERQAGITHKQYLDDIMANPTMRKYTEKKIA